MRRTTVRLLALLLALGAQGAARGAGQMTATALIRYDADSTTLTFCTMTGASGSPFGSPISPQPGRVKTSGSSTTVTSETASTSSLAPVVARDVLFVQRTSVAFDTALIVSKADADTVTVDAAVNWAGNNYTYLKSVCGTTATDGWVNTADAARISMTISYDQGDLDALAWQFQCIQAAPGSKPIVVYPSEGDGCGTAGTQSSGFCEFATASSTANFTWEEFGTWSRCRIGFKVKTTDTSEAGANLEQVSGSIVTSAGAF